MKRMLRGGVIATLVLCVTAGSVWAVPTLQIDLQGGTYRNETVYTDLSSFNLYALLSPEGTPDENSLRKATINDVFYLSIAVVPAVEAAQDLGSFEFNDMTIDVTDDMLYGVPPVEDDLAHKGKDLAPHGIYPTYFYEYAFTFNASNTTESYNTADHPGSFVDTPTGTMYFNTFTFDISNLNPNYGLHVDLYATDKGVTAENRKIVDFAPFSHDAQTDGHKVPEPGTLLLLGSGLLGLGLIRRKKN